MAVPLSSWILSSQTVQGPDWKDACRVGGGSSKKIMKAERRRQDA